MALLEGTSALRWAATRPEDNTPAVAVAVGHFVQVGLATVMGRIVASCRKTRKPRICMGRNRHQPWSYR